MFARQVGWIVDGGASPSRRFTPSFVKGYWIDYDEIGWSSYPITGHYPVIYEWAEMDGLPNIFERLYSCRIVGR